MSDEDKEATRRLQRYREVVATFATSSLPPMMSGHWLLKRNQAAAERTWTEASPAVEWMIKHYQDNPPFEGESGKQAYGDLDTKRVYALKVLPGGVDVSWVHYMKSGNILSVSVVCCPNIHHPDLVCPLTSAP